MSQTSALEAQLEADPTDAVTADALAELYTQAGEWTDLIGLLLDQLEHAKEGRKQHLLERAAEVFERRLSSADHALTTLLEAFAVRPDDARFSAGLARLAERAERWPELLDAYELGIAGVGDTPDALPLHRRLARWYETHDRLGDALRHWRSVMVYTPDDRHASRAVEALLESVKDWRGLISFLGERVEERFDEHERASMQARVVRLFEEQLGAPMEALRWVAERLLIRDEPALNSMLDRLAEQSGEWTIWAHVHEAALEHTFTNAEDAVPRHLRLAEIYRDQLGDARRASAHYRSALELDPQNIRAAHALCVLLEARGAWRELASVLEVLASLTTDPAGRYSAWLSLGELCKLRLADLPGAIRAWFKALEARPDDRLTLSRLLDGYHELQNWPASIKVLKKLIRVEPESPKKARFAYTLGVIQRDHLGDHFKAVRALDKALDFDPTFLKAFRAIDEILTTDQDPARQDRYYRKMLQRALDAGLDDGTVVGIARNLGEINRTRLDNPEAAGRAFRVALARASDDLELRIQTAQLTAVSDPNGGLKLLYEGLAARPDAIELYHALHGIYADNGAPELAWRVAAALCVSGHATSAQKRAFQGRRPRGAQPLARQLTGADWARIAPTDYSQPMGALLLQLNEVVAPKVAQTARALKLNPRKAELDPRAPTPIGQAFVRVSQITGLDTPRLFHTPGRAGLSTLNLYPLAIGVGSGLGESSDAELLFCVSRQLFLMGGQHALASIDPGVDARCERLRQVVELAQAATSGAAVKQGSLVARARQLGAPGLQQLASRLEAAADVWCSPDGIRGWLGAVEEMADRLGLLICGDLRAAARRIALEEDPLGGRSAQARISRLMAFGVSPDYFELCASSSSVTNTEAG